MWKIILLCVALFVVGVVAGKCATDRTDWQDTYKRYFDSTTVLLQNIEEGRQKFQDSIAVEVKKRDDSIKTLSSQRAILVSRNNSQTKIINDLKTTIDSIKPTLPETVVTYIETLEDKVQTQEEIIKSDSLTRQQLREKLDLNGATIFQLNNTIDTLVNHIKNIPEPEKAKKLLGLFDVSPTTAFTAGSLTTLVVIAGIIIGTK